MSIDTYEANKRVVRRFFEEVLNQRRPALVEELAHPDFVDHDPIGAGAERGVTGAKKTVDVLLSTYDDLAFTIDQLVAEDDTVVARWTLRAKDTKGFAGQPPTGKVLTERAIAIFRVAEGKIVERRAIVDRLGMLQQLGIVPGR